MVLPVVAYGHPNLRKLSEHIDADYQGLNELIADMFETMYASKGVGLAAPQVNRSIRLFIVDATPFAEDFPELDDYKKVFINPEIVEETGEVWSYSEGCLSIPEIHEEVERKPNVKLRYLDADFVEHEELFTGMLARIIQHEYDHLDGKLFVDYLSPIRKMLLQRRLANIASGNIECDYRMIFPVKKGKRK